MKKPMSLIFAATLVLSGCVTNPTTGQNEPDIQRIAAVAKEATMFGVSEALVEHPSWMSSFQVAKTQLDMLANANSITASELLDILNQLPIKELQSKNARIAISSARILIAGAGWSVIDAERLNQLRPVIVAISGGMEAAGVK